MYSGEGESVKFRQTTYPTGNVEDWLLEVERIMMDSLRLIIKESLGDYAEVRFYREIIQNILKIYIIVYTF